MGNQKAIGVFDTGIGGLSTVREIVKIMPGENILYYGDSANMPYGNRSEEEILFLTRRILGFMKNKNVKILAPACNTISALAGRLRPICHCEMISIVESGAAAAAASEAENIGIIATKFTVESGIYPALIHRLAPSVKVIQASCPDLARLIDTGRENGETSLRIITTSISALLKRAPLTHLVLGCTHYSLIKNTVQKLYPHLHIIDPAEKQAEAIFYALKRKKLLNNRQTGGEFRIFTSGSPGTYLQAYRKTGLTNLCGLPEICSLTPGTPSPASS